jgi:Domain of unknown function (DUF4268)
LNLSAPEQRVGPFKADIVATDGEDRVIVENQLDATDHRHLGQIMVYAAGQTAKTVVWVAKQVTDEYRKVFDWLNEETSTNFWALEIELWRIGDSAPSPKFNVVSEPNELTKSAAAESAELSENKLLQLDFWKGLADHLEQTGSSFNARKPQAAHWYMLGIGTSRANISLSALVAKSGRIGCELYISHSQADAIYEALEKEKDAIEAELGELEWQPLPEKKACRIAVYKRASIEDRDSWPALCQWLTENAEAFKSAFAERVKSVQLVAASPAEARGDAPAPTVAAPSSTDRVE